jgi:serine/threonine-protein kinase
MAQNLTGLQLGEYAVGQQLAEGGMGSVYRAVKNGSSDLLAIKVLLAEHDDNEEYRERFIREAQIMKSLQHPHILPVLDLGQQEDMLYFTMPLVKGPSLFELMGRRRFSPLTAWQILNPISQALDYAHERGVYHRDIKPGNILVESRPPDGNHVYLVDFGLSKLVDEQTLTRAGISVGTPQYMSPEQVMSRKITPESDLYALGVVLYEMLLGRLPFDSKRPQEVAFMHVRDAPPKPRSIHRDFPKSIEDVLLKALAKESRQRYASGHEFRMAYAQAVQQVDLDARSTEYWMPLPKA